MEVNVKKFDCYKTNPKADDRCIVKGETYRISILTERLVRLEFSKNGAFEDRMTQTVIHRDFPVPQFEVMDKENQVEITTKYLQISYDKKEFSGNGLSIRLCRQTYSNNSIWRYGDTGDNLKGTARTLDTADGAIDLEDGLLSRIGFSVLNDSLSMAIGEDGWVQTPLSGHQDIYFWGYGHDYRACLKDFFHLCGKTPLLPRYALGNWWSRYHAYTQEEYMELIERFRKEGLPFSVAVIDMDWHYVDLEEKYGSGWTGYSWNKELFPDHKKMLEELHERGYHVTLNVHPADGVRGHEDAYKPMAKALGVGYEKEIPIDFDIADPKFLAAYFKYLHHPLEEEGVDFWWIDWQQGNTTKIPGLDPLWMLNHYHFMDNSRNGKRPMIFSRYAGAGSHRYPVGFSGDSIISWKSLGFQPYFTATASNVGYGWWSHDIGGHMNGYRDDELAVRWVQYGVFSPIMRLHSSNSKFTGKEPWKYGDEERAVMNDFLRLRHRLIPYLYTMNARCYRENQPLIQPMYYSCPDQHEAYKVPNQYYFGSSLIVCPITGKMNPVLKAGKVKAWLPEGTWYDIFNGLIYRGNKSIPMYRTLKTIPVLAKAGAIVPMEAESSIGDGVDNPKDIELCVFAGADGEHIMYEDDGISIEYEEGSYAETKYTLDWNGTKRLTIYPAEGELSLIPKKRNYRIKLYGISKQDLKNVEVDAKKADYTYTWDEERNILTLEIKELDVKHRLNVWFYPDTGIACNKVQWRVFDILNRAQIEFCIKERLYDMAIHSDSAESLISNLSSVDTLSELKEMIQEIVFA
ncbi:MAG: DUF5110 domain-containing protein [Lachnospiraceae bacterium]|nr:DUF5110 domain-containing protein [Lachnospiraceae bacterium]